LGAGGPRFKSGRPDQSFLRLTGISKEFDLIESHCGFYLLEFPIVGFYSNGTAFLFVQGEEKGRDVTPISVKRSVIAEQKSTLP